MRAESAASADRPNRPEGCACGASLLGGTLHLREKRLRRGYFSPAVPCIVCSARTVASQTDGRKGDYQGASGRNIPGTAGKRANNINLVTPGHFAPQITEALRRAKRKDCGFPSFTIRAVMRVRIRSKVWKDLWISTCRTLNI